MKSSRPPLASPPGCFPRDVELVPVPEPHSECTRRASIVAERRKIFSPRGRTSGGASSVPRRTSTTTSAYRRDSQPPVVERNASSLLERNISSGSVVYGPGRVAPSGGVSGALPPGGSGGGFLGTCSGVASGVASVLEDVPAGLFGGERENYSTSQHYSTSGHDAPHGGLGGHQTSRGGSTSSHLSVKSSLSRRGTGTTPTQPRATSSRMPLPAPEANINTTRRYTPSQEVFPKPARGASSSSQRVSLEDGRPRRSVNPSASPRGPPTDVPPSRDQQGGSVGAGNNSSNHAMTSFLPTPAPIGRPPPDSKNSSSIAPAPGPGVSPYSEYNSSLGSLYGSAPGGASSVGGSVEPTPSAAFRDIRLLSGCSATKFHPDGCGPRTGSSSATSFFHREEAGALHAGSGETRDPRSPRGDPRRGHLVVSQLSSNVVDLPSVPSEYRNYTSEYRHEEYWSEYDRSGSSAADVARRQTGAVAPPTLFSLPPNSVQSLGGSVQESKPAGGLPKPDAAAPKRTCDVSWMYQDCLDGADLFKADKETIQA